MMWPKNLRRLTEHDRLGDRRLSRAEADFLVGDMSSEIIDRRRCHHRVASSGGVGRSSEREDDLDDVSSLCQVNDRMLGQLGNVGRCVLESPE